MRFLRLRRTHGRRRALRQRRIRGLVLNLGGTRKKDNECKADCESFEGGTRICKGFVGGRSALWFG